MMPYTRRPTAHSYPPQPNTRHAFERNSSVLHELHPTSWERYSYPNTPTPYGHGNYSTHPSSQHQHYENPSFAYAPPESYPCTYTYHQNIPHQSNVSHHHHNCVPQFSNVRHDTPPSPSHSETYWKEETSTTTTIEEIREEDVLCGRGAPSHHHPGNQHFRDLVNQWQSRYLAARRMDKPEIATRIVELVRERGGRFLKRTKLHGPTGHFCWQEIDEQRAYEKACQALREGAPELRKKLAAREIAAAALCLDSLGSAERVSLRSIDNGRDDESSSSSGKKEKNQRRL